MAYTALCMALLTGCGSLSVHEKEADDVRKAEVREQIEARTFKLEATYAHPLMGQGIPLNYPYSLRMAKDSVYVHLPYYGRAYALPYGGGEGLSFQGIVADYSQTLVKETYEISFSVRTGEDRYQFSLSVFDKGNAYISVMMNNKQGISFDARLDK